MFIEAIKLNQQYTRPFYTARRYFDSEKVKSDIATFMILNDEGWGLTCRHVAEQIMVADEINQKYIEYKEALKKCQNNKEKQALTNKYGYNDSAIIQMHNWFVNSFDNGQIEKIVFHKDLDLALIKWHNFTRVDTQTFPTFKNTEVEPGESVCRLGYSFLEQDIFSYDTKTEQINFNPEAFLRTPIFPLDGMVTRIISDNNQKIIGFETSSPGLRGQSGGPVFNQKGEIFGIQSSTVHLDLMFDIKGYVVRDNKNENVNEKQFINLGVSINSKQIIQVCQENGVKINIVS